MIYIGVLDGLQKFVTASQTKQIVMKIVAFSLSPAEINSLRDEFHSIDTNRYSHLLLYKYCYVLILRYRNGTISMGEMHDSIRSFRGIAPESLDRHCEQTGILYPTLLPRNLTGLSRTCWRRNSEL